MSQEHFFDVVIVGGGISGTSLLYTLARYSDIKKIALFEKCDEIASLNSNAKSNSQTLHAGDIETNYSLKKALKVKKSADMLERYALQYGYENKSIFNFPKMVIAVGDEVPYLKQRYGEFRDYYPYLKFWDKERLSALEPKLVEGRESDIVAMGSTEQFCAMDFGNILYALGIPKSMFTVIFVIGRTVGWINKWEEFKKDANSKIARPRQLYLGK